jgi:hypothetical protein
MRIQILAHKCDDDCAEASVTYGQVQTVAEHQQLCMHGQRLCGLQEAAQPSASEPAHQDSGNALHQVFARQAIKLLNLYTVTSFLLCEKQSSHTACIAIMKNASHEVSDA